MRDFSFLSITVISPHYFGDGEERSHFSPELTSERLPLWHRCGRPSMEGTHVVALGAVRGLRKGANLTGAMEAETVSEEKDFLSGHYVFSVTSGPSG